MTHLYSIETIHHFTCSECKNWWSYASTHFPAFSHLKQLKASCPHCGHKDDIEEDQKSRLGEWHNRPA